MKVVVAQHNLGRGSRRANHSQHLGRLRPAVHQVAYKPEPISLGTKGESLHQRREAVGAALYITNCIGSHAVHRKIETRLTHLKAFHAFPPGRVCY